MMPKVLTAIDHCIGFVEEITSVAGFVVVASITLIQVFWRYVLNSGILWTDEVITIFMVMMVMFGTAAMTRRVLHTELLVFVNKLPNRARRLVRILTSIIGLTFLCIFLFAATRYTFTSKGMVTTVLRIPMQYVLALLPIGALLSIYEYVKFMPNVFMGLERTSSESPMDAPQAEMK